MSIASEMGSSAVFYRLSGIRGERKYETGLQGGMGDHGKTSGFEKYRDRKVARPMSASESAMDENNRCHTA